MLEPQTKPMDDSRLKNIMRIYPHLGRSIASLVSIPTILSPKKIKKELDNERDMSMESPDSEMQAEPLPALDLVVMDPNPLVWNIVFSK